MAQIYHFLHGHILKLIVVEEEKVNDEVHCWRFDKVLKGRIYGCSVCKFYLHDSCAELPVEIENFFHPCPLVLDIANYMCNACFEHGSGFRYSCKKCDFDMHVKCVRRPTIESEEKKLIQHFIHWHPLKLVDLKVRCGICVKLCSVSSNSSVHGCKECYFFLHNSCMMNFPRQINYFSHPSCPLILLTPKDYKCASCDEDGSGLAFRCGKCHFQLDVKCALLPTVESKGAGKIQHYAHQHPLALRESKEFGSEVRCRACGEDCSLDPCFGCNKKSLDFF